MDVTEENKGTIEALRNLPIGKAFEVLPKTILIKAQKFQYRFANMYVLLNDERKEIFLIDAVREEAKQVILNLMRSGYVVRGISLTHNHLIGQAFSDMYSVSKLFGGAPLFMHPADISPYLSMMRSVVDEEQALQDFNLDVIHMGGHTYGSVSFYSPINGGTLFCGDNAVGSPYDMTEHYFERPIPTSSQMDRGLAKVWGDLDLKVTNILPLHGKPELSITAERFSSIRNDLSRPKETLSL